MPVSVHVPIRIRTDPLALEQGQAELLDALARSAGKQLRESRVHVLEPRGAYVGVRFERPVFHWTGAAAAQVSPRTRALLEAKISALLEQGAEQAGVFELARKNEQLPAPLEEEAVERLDRQRWMPGAYVLRSYGDGSVSFDEGEVISVDVRKLQARAKQKGSGLIPVPHWRVFSNPEDTIGLVLARAYEEGLATPLSEGEYSYPSPIGGIYLKPSAQIALCTWFWEKDQWQLENELTLINLLEFAWDEEKEQLLRQPIELPPGGVYWLEAYHPAATPADHLRVANQVLADALRSECRKLPRPPLLSPAEYDAQVESHVADAIQATVADVPQEATGFLVLRTPLRKPVLIATRLANQTELAQRVPIVSLREVELRPASELEGERSSSKGARGGKQGSGEGQGRGKGKGESTEPGSGEEPGEGSGEGEDLDRQSAKGQPPAIVYDPGASESDPRASKYPPVRLGVGEPLYFGPLNGEASLDELGADGNYLRRVMQTIADRLEMPMGEYPGAFAVAAAIVLAGRATQVGKFAVDQPSSTKSIEGGKGNLGGIQFEALPSPAVQLSRYLAQTCGHISQLRDALVDVYQKNRAQADLIRGMYRGDWAGWALHFDMALTPEMKDAVGLGLFVHGCQTLLLQLLRTSRESILQRKNNPAYAQFFQYLVVTQLTSVEKLLQLKSELDSFMSSQELSLSGIVRGGVSTWRDARRALGLAASGTPDVGGPGVRLAGGTVHSVNGTWIIRDDQGMDWSQKDLEEAIAIRRGTAEAIDPLVKQLTDLPEVMPKLRANPAQIPRYLDLLLDQMLQSNAEQTQKVLDSAYYAFRASKIREDLPKATIRNTAYSLQGIHLVFHETVGWAFHDDRYYGMGIDALFSAELGQQKLASFFEFTGMVLLSIACPPLAVAVGAGIALYRREQALERIELYRSLIDPELVASYAELELDLFLAELEVVLSVLPVAGKAVKVAAQGVRAALKQGLRQGVKSVSRQLLRSSLQRMAKELEHGLIVGFVTEVAQQQLLELVMQDLLEPVIAELWRELSVTGPMGVTSRDGGRALPTVPASGASGGAASELEQLRQLPVSPDEGPEDLPDDIPDGELEGG